MSALLVCVIIHSLQVRTVYFKRGGKSLRASQRIKQLLRYQHRQLFRPMFRFTQISITLRWVMAAIS